MSFDLLAKIHEAAPGASLAVPAGTYQVNLRLDKPLRLVAVGQVVLDGGRRGPVLTVCCTGGQVLLAGLLLAGGESTEGAGGLDVVEGQLEALDCTFRFNHAPLTGGGALRVSGEASAVLTRCRFEGNTGRQGGAVLVDELASLTLQDCLLAQNAAVLGGALAVREAASATLVGCTLADNRVFGEGAAGSAIFEGGSSTRAPSLTLRHCVLSERTPGPAFLERLAAAPGQLYAFNCLLPTWSEALDGDNLFAAAAFTLEGHEPYRLAADSPGAHAASDGAFAPLATDLTGHSRTATAGVGAALGAFALAKRSAGAYDSDTAKVP
jgi:hypothetical protein